MAEYVLLQRIGDEAVASFLPEAQGVPSRVDRVALSELPTFVAAQEAEHGPRWVFSDARRWLPGLLAAGVRIDRCWDLRLSRAILRLAPATADTDFAAAPRAHWDAPQDAPWFLPEDTAVDDEAAPALFDLDEAANSGRVARGQRRAAQVEAEVPGEFAAQHQALQQAAERGADPSAVARLRLLLAAESAGAVIAAELEYFGLPWSEAKHDALLTDLLGPRPQPGYRPAKLAALQQQISAALDGAEVNPDSPPDLLKVLRAAGLNVRSTSKWEIRELDHPVVAPLLDYKHRARLMTAHGWNWLDQWVRDGRFHPRYVVGGVVTGRWATDGGGAMQLPSELRSAIVADPGWKLIVADASQLEPRILSSMAADEAMLRAGAAGDLYEGIVATGAVATRDQAKYGMLGALYGGTRGESGRMLPRLAAAFPRAMALVEDAARRGERDEPVATWLGRGSPKPSQNWERVREVYGIDDPEDRDADGASQVGEGGSAASGQVRRAWGRFTRNYVVQGTAAEWAMSWMALLRAELRGLVDPATGAEPHLAYFLHDEVVVHAPAGVADRVAEAVVACAQQAGTLLFGSNAARFSLDVAVLDSYEH